MASMAVLGSGAAMTAPAAQSAPPDSDCATAYPVAEVTKGQQVDGLTVTEGTEPITFSGEVLGVLEDGIAPGVDMIIADMANEENPTRIDEVGIWQGMSGSPVYSEDGRLLGAVAYGLSWGPSTVAGITPYEKMDDYLPGQTGSTQVAVGDRMARTIAAESDVSARQASDGFRRLRVPLTISGISKSRLQQGRQERKYVSRQGRVGTLVGTASSTSTTDAASVKDGGNLGAAISYGTITAGGVGTVTDRCGDDVVGFGHPMMFSGRTSLGLMPADALYVQEDSLGSGYKVANLGAPAGTITQDRLTGITGAIGETPAEVSITSEVTYGPRDGRGVSHSLSQEWHASVTFMQVLSMHDVTIDAIQPGSETAGVVVTGTAADGSPFTLAFDDRYVSNYDIAFAGLWETADLVWLLSRMQGVEISSVTTNAEVTDSTATWRVGRVEQRRNGRWAAVTRRSPAVVSAGGTLHIRTLLTGAQGERWVAQSLNVPKAAGREGYLEVEGGAWTWNESLYDATTVQELQESLASDVRNDEVRASLNFWSRRKETRTQNISEPQDLVVTGQRRASVVVRR